MKAVLLLIAFVAGGVLTWLLTVHRETREVAADASDASDATDASGFGGPRSQESSGAAGSRWVADAQDEDALLADPGAAGDRPRTPPPA